MNEDFKTLALTLYGEARGEAIEGIIAVGCVIRNRVKALKQTYTQVCLAPNQFSCWNKNDPNYPILIRLSSEMDNVSDPYLRQCIYVAGGIIGGDILDTVHGVRNYMTSALYKEIIATRKNHWANNTTPVVTIAHHVFLKENEDTTTKV